MKFYSSTFVALFHGTEVCVCVCVCVGGGGGGGLEVYNSYLLQIWVLEDHLDVFLLYTDCFVSFREQKLGVMVVNRQF